MKNKVDRLSAFIAAVRVLKTSMEINHNYYKLLDIVALAQSLNSGW